LPYSNKGRGEIQGANGKKLMLLTQTPSKTCREFKSLKFLQIFHRHSKIASASLAQVIVDLDIDLVFIQKPYAFSATHPIVPNVPTGYSTFHALTKDHAYGSAIITRDLIATKFNLKKRHLDNHVACIELKTVDGPLCFCSLYSRPFEPPFLSLANTISDSIGSPNVVYGVESNARNPVWNSITTDVRGAELKPCFTLKN
jgi:hypothetical protein